MSGRYRPLKPEEKALLDELSRTTDPTQELRAQFAYLLETSPLERDAFIAELLRLRALKAKCHANKSRLPKPVSEELERAAPRTTSFEHLMAQADFGRDPELAT